MTLPIEHSVPPSPICAIGADVVELVDVVKGVVVGLVSTVVVVVVVSTAVVVVVVGLVSTSMHMGLRWARGFTPVLVLNHTVSSSAFVMHPN